MLCIQFNLNKEKNKINHKINQYFDEKPKLTNKRKEAASNKISISKTKVKNQIKKENDALQKVFLYKNNRKKVQK